MENMVHTLQENLHAYVGLVPNIPIQAYKSFIYLSFTSLLLESKSSTCSHKLSLIDLIWYWFLFH